MPRKSTAVAAPSVPVELVERRIFLIRSQKVMLDADLAELYKVSTKVLNQAVSRNRERFPEDFMFQLTETEASNLRSQFVTSSSETRWGGRRYLPHAFTEHGVAMLSSVLRSRRAVQMNIVIVRAFVRLRQMIASHRDFAKRMEKLEAQHKDHAALFSIVIKDVEDLGKTVARKFQMITAPRKRKVKVGFYTGHK